MATRFRNWPVSCVVFVHHIAWTLARVADEFFRQSVHRRVVGNLTPTCSDGNGSQLVEHENAVVSRARVGLQPRTGACADSTHGEAFVAWKRIVVFCPGYFCGYSKQGCASCSQFFSSPRQEPGYTLHFFRTAHTRKEHHRSFVGTDIAVHCHAPSHSPEIGLEVDGTLQSVKSPSSPQSITTTPNASSNRSKNSVA